MRIKQESNKKDTVMPEPHTHTKHFVRPRFEDSFLVEIQTNTAIITMQIYL